MTLIGFKITLLTDLTRAAAHDFIKSVCFLREQDIQDLLNKWMYVTIYSTEITEGLLAAQPFPTVGVYENGLNTLINNVENKLELPYVDPNGQLQIIYLGITECKTISNFIRNQLLPLEVRFVIRYLNDTGIPGGQGDFTKDDYTPDDYLTS